MKNADLVLSELANRYGVDHGSKDTPEDIGQKLVVKIDGMAPLELSEREQNFAATNLTTQVELLLAEGRILPVQAEALKKLAKSDDLVLSEGTSAAIDGVLDVLRMGKAKSPAKQRSGVQDLSLAEGDEGEKSNADALMNRACPEPVA